MGIKMSIDNHIRMYRGRLPISDNRPMKRRQAVYSVENSGVYRAVRNSLNGPMHTIITLSSTPNHRPMSRLPRHGACALLIHVAHRPNLEALDNLAVGRTGTNGSLIDSQMSQRGLEISFPEKARASYGEITNFFMEGLCSQRALAGDLKRAGGPALRRGVGMPLRPVRKIWGQSPIRILTSTAKSSRAVNGPPKLFLSGRLDNSIEAGKERNKRLD